MILDSLRALAIVEAAVVFGVATRVLMLYSLANHLATVRGEKVRALLPQHVAFIAGAFLVYVAAGMARMIELVGDPLSIDATPTALVANTLGIYALWVVMRFEQRRVDVEKSYITDLRGAPVEEERRSNGT